MGLFHPWTRWDRGPAAGEKSVSLSCDQVGMQRVGGAAGGVAARWGCVHVIITSYYYPSILLYKHPTVQALYYYTGIPPLCHDLGVLCLHQISYFSDLRLREALHSRTH